MHATIIAGVWVFRSCFHPRFYLASFASGLSSMPASLGDFTGTFSAAFQARRYHDPRPLAKAAFVSLVCHLMRRLFEACHQCASHARVHLERQHSRNISESVSESNALGICLPSRLPSSACHERYPSLSLQQASRQTTMWPRIRSSRYRQGPDVTVSRQTLRRLA